MFRSQRMILLPLIVLLSSALDLPTTEAATTYRTDLLRWDTSARPFDGWKLDGVRLDDSGALRLDPAAATPGSDPYAPSSFHGRNFYNGGNFVVGEAISPASATAFQFSEAIGSWNAVTPAGSWIELQMRAQIGRRWTTWYNMGVWAADESTVARHSVDGQRDTNGRVAVDTLKLSKSARAVQIKLRLFSTDGSAVPAVRSASIAISTTPRKPGALTPGDPAHWNHVLDLPSCSQMVYPDGGEVWCSPTSLSMVLKYWQNDTGPCEPRVRATVAGVYDWLYDGHGNWPFNTAFAAEQGYTAVVTRMTSLAQAEAWVAAGVPVIISTAWGRGDLDGAPISTSGGHLSVLVGFDAQGNPVVNDPAAARDDAVRRTYDRAQLEQLWLQHSGGTVYLIYPADHAVPEL